MRKICIATGSRAEYGLLKPLLDKISFEKDWVLQLLVTGMHLSPEFGLTYKEVDSDGFQIDKKVEILMSSDTPAGIIKSMGVALIGFADALTELRPDLIIILGDRFEVLAVAEAALILKIPVAHIHGGEVTEGAYDNSIRNAISKMSHLHFTAAEEYKKRLIQMGEDPTRVFNVGAIGLDNINSLQLLSRSEVETLLGFEFHELNYLVTFHPTTLSEAEAEKEFEELLSAIDEQKNSFFIFTKANADNGGRAINQMIDNYVAKASEKSIVFTSLGQKLYLSLMQYVDGVIGNSSSGIIEAPSYKVPVINIGSRQTGRIFSENIINCKTDRLAIKSAFNQLNSDEFKSKVQSVENPYGKGNAATLIIEKLKLFDWSTLVYKKFFDIKF